MNRNRLMATAATAQKIDRSWEARDALNTLKRADEIQRDRGLMKMVKKCAKDDIKCLAKVAGSKKRTK
jgi:hypothetical protein